MATWNDEMTRYERPASTNRLRDLLVMAAFSMAALVAAFTFVQFKYGDPTVSAPSEAPAETAASDAPPSATAMDVESQARNEIEDARPVTAMQLALARLPEDTAAPSARPWVGETAGALVEAMGSQRELGVLRGHEGYVYAAGFSPDGARIVSGSFDDTLRVWDAASGSEVLVLRGHEGYVYAAGSRPTARAS